MIRKRSASIGNFDCGSVRRVTDGGGRSAFAGETAAPGGKARIPARGECVIIDLSTARARESHPRRIAASAPDPSAEEAAERTTGRARHYIEALVGWLLIFGAAYLALLLIGG